jgi:hypothetical protein
MSDLLSPDQIRDITAGLTAAAHVAETRFQDIGESLQQAVAMLTRMTATFQDLHARLDGAELAEATTVLSGVAGQMTRFADVSRQDEVTLEQLARTASLIVAPLEQMRKLAGEVDILAMNARMTAAGMGDNGADFMVFASDIRRSGQRAEENLRLFHTELTQASQDLQTAQTLARGFATRHGASMSAIPGQLADTVASIAGRTRMATAAAATVTERSRLMAERVGQVVVALQLGDITRQRIEHALISAALLLAVVQPGADAETPWPDLDAGQQACAAVAICRLSAAQLADTDGDLEREGAHINTLLQGLMADAADVVRIGHTAYADVGADRGTFLGELEKHVREAHVLIGGLQAGQEACYGRIETVLSSAQHLLDRIDTVRSVEGDIHLMGLNTILKCGRLGKEGRPLAVIAQALRECGKRTAGAAAAMLTGLEQLMAGAGSLHDSTRGQAGAVMADLMRMTNAAAEQLGVAQTHLATALGGLECDSVAVKDLLDAALARFAARQQIADAVRRGKVVFEQVAQTIGDKATDSDAVRARVLAQVAVNYTMDREREVHRRFAPPGGHPADAAPVQRQQELEDILF